MCECVSGRSPGHWLIFQCNPTVPRCCRCTWLGYHVCQLVVTCVCACACVFLYMLSILEHFCIWDSSSGFHISKGLVWEIKLAFKVRIRLGTREEGIGNKVEGLGIRLWDKYINRNDHKATKWCWSSSQRAKTRPANINFIFDELLHVRKCGVAPR